MPSPRPLLLLDSASLYYRSYFALPESMTAPDGRPHNAIRGFLSTITRLVDKFQAGSLAACWDADWRPQWRVDLVPSYKTHRLADGSTEAESEPDTLTPQIGAIARLLDAMGVARPWAADHEADDVIASLAAQANGPTIVVTGDRDLVQVVRDRPDVRVFLATNGGMDKWPLLGTADVVERYGVEAVQYVDFAVLRGDPSDGLPGVPGIGAKTAASLLAEFGSIDALLQMAGSGNLGKPLTPRIALALTEHAEELRAAQTVATAVTTLAVREPTDLPARPADPDAVNAIADQWGVRRFIPDLGPAS